MGMHIIVYSTEMSTHLLQDKLTTIEILKKLLITIEKYGGERTLCQTRMMEGSTDVHLFPESHTTIQPWSREAGKRRRRGIIFLSSLLYCVRVRFDAITSFFKNKIKKIWKKFWSMKYLLLDSTPQVPKQNKDGEKMLSVVKYNENIYW